MSAVYNLTNQLLHRLQQFSSFVSCFFQSVALLSGLNVDGGIVFAFGFFFLHHRSIEGKKVCPGYTTSELRYSSSLSQKLHLVYSVCVDFTRWCHTFVVSCLICSFAPNLDAFRQTPVQEIFSLPDLFFRRWYQELNKTECVVLSLKVVMLGRCLWDRQDRDQQSQFNDYHSWVLTNQQGSRPGGQQLLNTMYWSSAHRAAPQSGALSWNQSVVNRQWTL